MPSPAEYTRRVKTHELRDLFWRRGKVYSVTTVTVPPAGFESLAPYSLLMVEFPDKTKKTLMGMGDERFEIGDEVECVVGANPASKEGIISYIVKARHPVRKLPTK